MNLTDKKTAENILHHLCYRKKVCGIRWYNNIPVLIIDQPGHLEIEEVYLRIESNWFFDGNIHRDLTYLPENVKDIMSFREKMIDQLAFDICSIRTSVIEKISLAETIPHLEIYFDNGKHLFVNGHDEEYECWELFTPDVRLAELKFSVLAISGDEIIIEMPSQFIEISS